MKNLLKLTLIALLALMGTNVYGQKFGYINTQELLMAMPETDSVNIKLETLSKEWQEQLEVIQVEFNNKLQDYQKNSATYTDAMKQVKEQELDDLTRRYQEFNELASQNIRQKQQELLAPVLEKAENAIKQVGKNNGFTVIFDSTTASLVYWNDSVEDVLPLVKKELGLPETTNTNN